MKNVIVFPSRAVAIEDALHLFSPRLAIVDEHLTKHFPKQWITSLAIKVIYLTLYSSVSVIPILSSYVRFSLCEMSL